MSNSIIPSYIENFSEKAALIGEAAIALQKNGGFTYDGLNKSRNELKSAGIDLNLPNKMEKFITIGKQTVTAFDGKSSVSLSGPDPVDSSIGIRTFEISNQLIQDIGPTASFEDSPVNVMMPYKNIPSVQYQQDILASLYGYADGDSGPDGAANVVPLLETTSNSYKGFSIREMSFLQGYDLIALREIGTNETERRGSMQKINYGKLNLLQRAGTGLELNRLDMLIKGSWSYQESSLSDPLIISGGISANNVTTMSQSLGSYVKATNTFTPNASLTINPLEQLGVSLTNIKNMGMDIDKIVIDNITYGAIFNSPLIASQTQYVSAVSSNNVMETRKNLFQITTIPALQGIPIEVDNRAWKTDSKVTTPLNTRPLWWGKTVTSSSFRALIVVKPKGLSRVGDFGFFPNLYARTTQIGGGSTVNGGYGGGITMVMQDLSVQDITNQKIQLLAASNSAPMLYLPNMVRLFDFNVSVS
jgi:hypothetical protein